jgi:hypothetical protein
MKHNGKTEQSLFIYTKIKASIWQCLKKSSWDSLNSFTNEDLYSCLIICDEKFSSIFSPHSFEMIYEGILIHY